MTAFLENPEIPAEVKGGSRTFHIKPPASRSRYLQALAICPLLTVAGTTQASPQPCITSPTEDCLLVREAKWLQHVSPRMSCVGLHSLNKYVFTMPADLWQMESEGTWEEESQRLMVLTQCLRRSLQSQEHNPGILAPSAASLFMRLAAVTTLTKIHSAKWDSPAKCI